MQAGQISAQSIRHLARGLLVLLLSLVIALAPVPSRAVAQQGGGAIRVDVNLVLVEATVKDRSGKIIDGLKQSDFEVLEDGAPQTVSHFSRDQLPLAVALVVDLSGSIKPFLKPLRYATLTALKTLKPEDQVALFTFTQNVDQRVQLTNDKREVSDQLEFFEAGGGTNINRAIYDAARYLEKEAPAARRVIVLVSDNVATTPDAEDAKQVTEAALEADAPVYSLKVPGDNPVAARVLTVGRGLVNVSKLAPETGGEIFEVEKEGSLFLAFQALIERLKTRYTLGFYPQNPGPGRTFHKLSLRLQPRFGTKGHDYTIVSKTGYYTTPSR